MESLTHRLTLLPTNYGLALLNKCFYINKGTKVPLSNSFKIIFNKFRYFKCDS